MIHIDTIWLATELMDMHSGIETAPARVITVFGAAKPHCVYLFATEGVPSSGPSRAPGNGFLKPVRLR